MPRTKKDPKKKKIPVSVTLIKSVIDTFREAGDGYISHGMEFVLEVALNNPETRKQIEAKQEAYIFG